jgi:hypothetical protein
MNAPMRETNKNQRSRRRPIDENELSIAVQVTPVFTSVHLTE